eukprot:361164-Chlamydomonas_euryale.AAC.1
MTTPLSLVVDDNSLSSSLMTPCGTIPQRQTATAMPAAPCRAALRHCPVPACRAHCILPCPLPPA